MNFIFSLRSKILRNVLCYMVPLVATTLHTFTEEMRAVSDALFSVPLKCFSVHDKKSLNIHAFATELLLTFLIWIMRLPSNATFTHFYMKIEKTVTEPLLTWKSSKCNWTTALPTLPTLKHLISWNNVTQLCRHEMQGVMNHSSLAFTYHGRESHCDGIPLANSKMRWANGDRQRYIREVD